MSDTYTDNRQYPLIRLCARVLIIVSLCANAVFAVLLLSRDIRTAIFEKLEERFFTAQVTIQPGRWHKRKGLPGGRHADVFRKLEAIGYVDGKSPAPPAANVTVYDPDRAFNGLNLYTSGHAPIAILMDMKGRALHSWRYDFQSVWPDAEVPDDTQNHRFWRRVHLCENGDLLAIFEGLGLIKLDKHSNLLWDYPGRAHHDLFVMNDGSIYVLTREAALHPRYDKQYPVLEDFICILDSRGREVRKISILESIEKSRYSPLLSMRPVRGDFMHTNTLEVLDGRLAHRSPAFSSGNVLISMLKLDTIGIINIDRQRMVWALTGMWRLQHQPTVLDSGTMLIFDNQGHRGKSRVLEFDPFTQEIAWVYAHSPEQPFFSEDCGSSAQLPNGNVLISETNSGRAFEVTPDKTVVWEFYSPHRAGENGQFIASLFEMIRFGPGRSFAWLDSGEQER